MATFSNPFDGAVQGGIAEMQQQFLMFYYLPPANKVGSQTTLGPTYYTTWRANDGTNAVWGALNYTVMLGEPYAFKYKRAQNGYIFLGNTISGYGTNVIGFSADAYSLKENSLTLEGYTSWSIEDNVDNSYSGTTFQLKQLNTNLPTDAIFSGIWYTMESNGNVVIPPVFDQSLSKIGLTPFPNLETTTMTFKNQGLLQNPYVMFIPFTPNVSYWINGACTKGSYNSPMIMINDWIMTANNENFGTSYQSLYTQEQCFGYLGKNSKFCTYVGGDCNGGLGYAYCGDSNSCGKCYGACTGAAKGLNCIWDNASGISSSVFYCSHLAGSTSIDPDSTGGANEHKWVFVLVLVIIIFMTALLILFYLIEGGMIGGKKRKK